MGNFHPEKTNVDRGEAQVDIGFSRGDNFPCYPFVQSIFIYIYIYIYQPLYIYMHFVNFNLLIRVHAVAKICQKEGVNNIDVLSLITHGMLIKLKF